jgi:hypothetical protein
MQNSTKTNMLQVFRCLQYKRAQDENQPFHEDYLRQTHSQWSFLIGVKPWSISSSRQSYRWGSPWARKLIGSLGSLF